MTQARHRAAVTALGDPAAWPESGFWTQVRVLTARSLRTAFGDRRLVFFGLLQPVVLLLLFSQVFSGVGELPGVAAYQGYVNFLVPATLVNIAMTTAMSSGAGLLAEIYGGFTGRLRCLPIALFSVLLARTLADAARLAVQLAVTALASVVFLGFRPAGGVPGLLAALALTLVVGWCLSWVFVAITTWLRKAETLQAASFVVMFPLMFSSSAYMPLDTMPAWVRAVSAVNPLTYAIDATRALALGRPIGWSVLTALVIAAVAAVAGSLLAARTFRNRA
ncbi:ABC transporter permease [Amycolatopsis vancoresmycina]|uniref:Transport permease protein n=1 Tax=Amycolatopsis vancoresmycina DSM 44592 TaxID=1292037 RepID=R1G2P0_9PSEU|nr:ABC transporter permease [Amycolatopsis vancoresmycina]EOD65773.1 ABC transporter [Amycolatopsis vancoresmycina DSM 44592]